MTANMLKALRAIIYVRLSSYRGAAVDPSTSPERQEDVSRSYCQAKGWEVVRVVADLDESGSDKGLRLDRPGLREVRAALAAGEADVVVFAKLDRLARNVVDFRTFADEAASHGAALVSVAESLDLTTPSGRFVATILAAFAEMEAAAISTRVLEGIERVRALGRWAGGNPPYGYRIVGRADGPGYLLAPDPTAAEVVREAARRVLAGESLYSIALDFNARGIPTQSADLAAQSRTRRKPAKWSTTTLGRLLTNPAMVGRSIHRGDVLRGDDGMPRQVWEPILDLNDWYRLCAIIPSVHTRTATDRRPPRRRAARLLSGLALCDECGSKLYVTARSLSGGRTRPIYVCPSRRNGLPCRGLSISAAPLEAYVAGEMLDLVGAWPVVRYVTVAVDDAERADIEAAISDLARQMTERGADVAALAARLTELHARRDALPATAPTEVRRVETGRTFAEEWYDPATTTDARRELLSSYVAAVRIAPGTRGRKGLDAERVTIVTHDNGDVDAE